MQIDRILFPVTALGPGNRMVIWMQGCHKRCNGCANPELQQFEPSKNIPITVFKDFLASLHGQTIDGFTLTGGEPLAQAEELVEWISEMKQVTEDILLFTGYYPSEVSLLSDASRKCFSLAAIAIAGEYIDGMNDNQTALIASKNQIVIWNQLSLKEKYNRYMKEGRKIENIYYKDALLSVGIHNRRDVDEWREYQNGSGNLNVFQK